MNFFGRNFCLMKDSINERLITHFGKNFKRTDANLAKKSYPNLARIVVHCISLAKYAIFVQSCKNNWQIFGRILQNL